MSDNGIRALRVILDDEPATLWVGQPHEASIKDRLVLWDNVDALEACFDISYTNILR